MAGTFVGRGGSACCGLVDVAAASYFFTSSNATAVGSGSSSVVVDVVLGGFDLVDIDAVVAAVDHYSGVVQMHWLLTSHQPHGIHNFIVLLGFA